MENKIQSLSVNSLIFGLITGFTLILLSIGLFATSKYGSGLQYIGYLILAAGIVIGTLNYRDKNTDGYISYGRCVGSGTLISLYAGIILAAFTIVYMRYVNTGFVEEMMGRMQIEWEKQGRSEEQIAVLETYSRKMFSPVPMFFLTIVGYVFTGTIISLLSSIFIRKDRPPFDNITDQNPL